MMLRFTKLRKKAKNRRRERVILITYAIVVTFALVVSLHHNNNVNASINREEPIAYFDSDTSDLIEETIEETAQTEEVENKEAQDGDIDSMYDSASQTSNINTEQFEVEVKSGDTFINILTGMGLEYQKAYNIFLGFKNIYNVAKELKVGQKFQITAVKDLSADKLIDIESIMIEPKVGTRYFVEKDDNDNYVGRTEQDEFKKETRRVRGEIHGTTSISMQNAGVPRGITADFTSIFGFSVDFSRDIHPGDKFEVVYEVSVAPDGTIVKNGDVLYAELELGKSKLSMYRFKDSSGKSDYFDEKGQALKKTLNKKPLAFSRARISSRFGNRFHPILKQYKFHSGVDYAAPSGTQIYAAGDGVVQMAKYNGGYGHFVKIRHNSEYTTGYGHMKGYAKGIRPGVRVKQGQVIGYVGSTGRSTGPHLHFEIIRNGKKVDPLKVKAATGENLTGKNLQAFKRTVAQIEDIRHPKTAEAVVNEEIKVSAASAQEVKQ